MYQGSRYYRQQPVAERLPALLTQPHRMKLITLIPWALFALAIFGAVIAALVLWKMKKEDIPDYYDSERPYIDKH